MIFIDYLFLYSMTTIWLLLGMNIVLTYFGYLHSVKVRAQKFNILTDMQGFKTVSIMIPAHNEEKVIRYTVEAMLKIDYPNDLYEILVVNDGSKDNTEAIVRDLQKRHPDRRLVLVNVPKEEGGKGKSNALNYGFKQSTGEYIVIYDADNTPNRYALRYLVHEISTNPGYGAVIGKFRTRNKNRNLLTRFINIETLSFQWMAQAGRWRLFRLCTIPGTNFIVRSSILREVGGWDIQAVAEDTELSFRIYQMGYEIAFMPLAETYEQEPESLKVWFKQRTRWVNGNIYVLVKYLKIMFKIGSPRVLFDLYYYFSVYFLFLSSIIVSDIIFILGLLTDYQVGISGNFVTVWIMTYLVFALQISIALSIEKGEISFSNILLILAMYFSYCQLWLFVSFYGFYQNFRDRVLKRKTRWYKTERF